MFRKAVRQEGLEPASQDSNPEEVINRGVVGLISVYQIACHNSKF